MFASLLATVLALSHFSSVQSVGDADVEPVYFLNNQRFIEYGGVFELLDDAGTPNRQGFQLAEAFACGTVQIGLRDMFPGSTVNVNIIDDPVLVSAMSDVAKVFGEKNIVVPVTAINDAKLVQFSNNLMQYEAPVLAYMEPGTVQTEVPVPGDLIFSAPVDSYQSKPLVSLAKVLKIKAMSVVSTNDPTMLNVHAAFTRDLANFANTADQIKVSCSSVNIGETAEQATLLECAQRTNVEQIAIFATAAEAPDLIYSLYEKKIIGERTIIFASNNWAVISVFDEMIALGVPRVNLLSTFAAFPYQGTSEVLRKCLEQRTAEINPYDGYVINYENIMKCTIDSDEEECEALRELTDDSLSTTCKCRSDENLSSMEIDNKGINYIIDSVIASANAYATVISTGCGDIASNIGADEAVLCGASGKVTGHQIALLMRNLTFSGLTGDVLFNSSYRRFAKYDIYQFSGSSLLRVANYSIPADLGDLLVNIDYTKSVLEGKSSLVSTELWFIAILWDDPVAIAITVLTSIGLALTLATTVFVATHKDHPVIKRASPMFCAFMLTGIATLYFQLFLWIGKQNAVMCTVKVWIPFIGFSLLMGPMLAKTFRIWKIFDNSKLRTRRILTSHLLIMSGIVIGVQLVLLSIWTGVDPLHVEIVEFTYGACVGYNSAFQTALFSLFVIFNGVLLLLGSFLSYNTRAVASSFNESTYIASAMYNFTLCMAVLLPIYEVIKEGDKSANLRSFLIRSIAVLFANTACLLILFGPKVYHVIKKTEDRGDLPSTNANSSKKGAVASGKPGQSNATKNSTLQGTNNNTMAMQSNASASKPEASVSQATTSAGQQSDSTESAVKQEIQTVVGSGADVASRPVLNLDVASSAGVESEIVSTEVNMHNDNAGHEEHASYDDSKDTGAMSAFIEDETETEMIIDVERKESIKPDVVAEPEIIVEIEKPNEPEIIEIENPKEPEIIIEIENPNEPEIIVEIEKPNEPEIIVETEQSKAVQAEIERKAAARVIVEKMVRDIEANNAEAERRESMKMKLVRKESKKSEIHVERKETKKKETQIIEEPREINAAEATPSLPPSDASA